MKTDWKDRHPGKYQGNASVWKAQVLHDKTMDSSWLAGQFGDVEFGGWFGLLIGKRYAWIIGESNDGFFTIIKEGKPEDMEGDFVDMETTYNNEQDLINIDPTGFNAI